VTEHVRQLDFRVNRHVERMQRYIPLDAGADQLVHELVDVEEAVDLETVADHALLDGVQTPSMRIVLLTGDAGHGKTRLCCQLLERLGYGKREAADAIRDRSDGTEDLAAVQGGRALRVVKDLSDFDPEDGAEIVVQALETSERVTVICGNEGRLRDVVSRRPEELGVLLLRLEQGLRGDAASSEGILVVNLNFQSVAAQGDSLVEGLLRRWVGDGRNWSACTTCRARGLCPIYENRRLLTEEDDAAHRAVRWAELLRIAERTGVVITIRELLVTVAFAITSGLRCQDVHERVEQKPVDRTWQWEHVFFQALFERIRLLEETSPGLRVPPAMRRLDPGHFADRRIDESLSVTASDGSFRPLDPTGDVIGVDWRDVSPARARAEQLTLIRFLRRRAFFEDPEPGAAGRAGLRFGDQFGQAVGQEDPNALREIRDRIVRGLAAAQGLTNTRERPSALPVVEPALATRNGGVAILDRDIRLADVKVMAQSTAWGLILGRQPELVGQVDWLERSVAVLIENHDVIELDLRAFELVCAAGEGLDLPSADPGVARRLLLQLAALAGNSADSEPIAIVEPGRRWKIDLDIGDQLIGSRS
jgi:hypothetical protein